jgi:hypothetical protein
MLDGLLTMAPEAKLQQGVLTEQFPRIADRERLLAGDHPNTLAVASTCRSVSSVLQERDDDRTDLRTGIV